MNVVRKHSEVVESVVDGEDVMLSRGESVLILAALCTLAASILSFPLTLA